MSLTPRYTNPLQDYVNNNTTPSMTVDGIVVDRVYAATGIIDTINQNQNNTYKDPVTNELNNPGQVSLKNAVNSRSGYTSDILDDVYNTGLSMDFKFNRTTYINYFSFNILQVPCSWTLYRAPTGTINFTPNQQIYSGVITAFNTSYLEPISIYLDNTWKFDTTVDLFLVINKTVNGQQYPITIRNFIAKLEVFALDDIIDKDTNVVIPSITTQNNLGFIETYTPSFDSLSNMVTIGSKESTSNSILNPGTYWKSSPQPVQDAVVWVVIDLGWRQTIDKMFLDPLYVNQVLNVYYSDIITNTTDTSTLTWYPVQKDLITKKGVYEFPLINTRYIKLEFYQLTAEVYDLPVDSVDRTIQVFPDWVDNYFNNIEQNTPDINSQQYAINTDSINNPYLNYNTSPIMSSSYGLVVDQLSASTYGGSTTNPASSTSLESKYTIVDPTASYKTLTEVAGVGSAYNNSTAPNFINKRFPVYGTHVYKNVFMNQTWHQAYFTGIKYLSFYVTNQLLQNDNPEFVDYFLPTTISGIDYASPNTLISGGVTTATFSQGGTGGYVGLAATQIQTQYIKTISSFNSFKFGALNTDWQEFLTTPQTLLRSTPSIIGVVSGTINASDKIGISYNFNNVSPDGSSGYGIYTVSGTGDNYIQTALGVSNNLLTVSMAQFTASGWTGTDPTASAISGINSTNIPSSNINSFLSTYGSSDYANNDFGGIPQVQSQPYTFLVTSSGLTGSVNIQVNYFNNGTFIASSGHTFAVVANSGNNLSFTTTQPIGANQVNFVLSGSGSTTYSQAGYFYGTSAIWSSPVRLQDMRISATARIYLPETNYGTYTCGIYTANGTLLASKSFSNIPVKTWVDIEVPYTIFNSSAYNNGLYARLTQTFGQSERYEVALLGMFYNPVAWQYSIDNTNWYDIVTGICDPQVFINLPQATQQLMIKGTILLDNTTISAISIVPTYLQNPNYTSTVIDYLGDPKYNEVSMRKTTAQRPLFQLSTELHPTQFNITELMNIQNPFQLD